MSDLARRAVLACLVCVAALSAVPARSQNFLWEVTSLTNRAWLFGTLHAGKADWYPLPRAVEDAFESSDVLAVEADITNAAEMRRSGDAMVYTPPDALRLHVPVADYARFLTLLPRYGVPESQVEGMKPFMAVSLLVFGEWVRQGYQPAYGVDGYLIQEAKARHKPLVELDGVDAQMRLMDSLTDRENTTNFHGTVEALASGLTAEQIRGMVRAWEVGDPQMMLDVSRRYDDRVKGAAEFEDKFVWSRHPGMLAKIEDFLDRSGKRYFIAVGSLHLVGPRGLVQQLREHGYTVRQVFVAPREEARK
jgi:hypothetical protein